MNRVNVLQKKNLLPAGFVLIIVVLAVTPQFINPYMVIFLTSVFMYIVLTTSWAIFSGPTRYISLASAAFFGIGIYTSAVIGEMVPLPLVILFGALASFIFALIIGLLTFSLKGMYFIIFTFVSSELLRNFILWWENMFTGTVGRWVLAVDNVVVYYILLGILVLTILFTVVIRKSRYGLMLNSIGESEEAAGHIGINTVYLKIMAFAVSALFMGAAGAIMATRWTYIDPMIAFNPLYSFLPVLMAIFGGIEYPLGHVVGAVIFSTLEELLITQFPYYYMLIFGLILVIAICFLPEGIVGKWHRRG